MSKHTPGPWFIWGNPTPAITISAENILVATTVGGNDEANARLIAAAPEMLEVLKLAKQKRDEGHSVPSSLIDACEAAIAKAEGK